MMPSLLKPSEDATAVSILVQAFGNDPVMNWISASSEFRTLINAVAVPLFREQGTSYLAPDATGVALWMGPGNTAQWPATAPPSG